MDNVDVILSSDLNSRTASNSQIVSMTDEVFDSLQASQAVNVNRNSQENVLNNYGKLVLNVCTTFDFCILNGVRKGDLQGCYTYISETGCSVNDYFVLSGYLYALMHSTCELCVTGLPNRITCHLHFVSGFQRRMCATLKLKLSKRLCGTVVMNKCLLV